MGHWLIKEDIWEKAGRRVGNIIGGTYEGIGGREVCREDLEARTLEQGEGH